MKTYVQRRLQPGDTVLHVPTQRVLTVSRNLGVPGTAGWAGRDRYPEPCRAYAVVSTEGAHPEHIMAWALRRRRP